MEPLITVIVPVYNVEKYLDKCVESIVNQTYKNLEIILVDDGSPDNCPAMCDEWAKKESRIKVIHKANGGLSSARNAGIDIMSGQYVMFIDSDDYIEFNAVEIMYDSIQKADFDVCVCNVNHVNNNGEIIDKTEFKPIELFNEKVIQAFLNTNVFDSSSACDKLYKFSIIEEHNLRFDETNKWGEDFPFNYFYFKFVNKMISIEDCLYNYLQGHEGSITDGMTYGKATRYNNYKEILLLEKNDKKNYEIALKKYSSELLCCLRELLRSNNKELIDQCCFEICNEVKLYSKKFLKLSEVSKLNKISILLICINPRLFRLLYSIYKR
ncbi:MAG: glycosyltransferase family 2 protein [Eubacterium sp.]